MTGCLVDVCRLWCSLTNAEEVLMLAVEQLIGYHVDVTIVNDRHNGHSSEVMCHILTLTHRFIVRQILIQVD